MNMIRITLVVVACALFSAGYGQGNRVLNAYNYLKSGDYDLAKENIDAASVHPKTMAQGKTWYYRGQIYEGIYLSPEEKYAPLKEGALLEATEAYEKAMEIGSKMYTDREVRNRYRRMANLCFSQGVTYYNEKDYKTAITYFETCQRVKASFDVVDSLALYNEALAYENLENYDKAITGYKKCIEINYNAEICYGNLAYIYQGQGDEEAMLSIVKEGRQKFPNNQDLLTTEINLYLKQNKLAEALDNLNLAIGNDPGNAILLFARGTIFNNSEDVEKAEADYLKAIELKPDYFDALYNLGALYFNLGADKINDANEVVENSLYKKLKEEATAYFEKALPYLEKAHELNPSDKSTMESLKQLYVRLGQTEKYNAINEKLSN